MTSINRRRWIRQSVLSTMGLGISLKGISEDLCMPRASFPDTGIINLGANENPYGMSPQAKQAIHGLVDGANRYGFNIPATQTLAADIAGHWGIDTKQVLLLAGSGESLKLLPRHFSKGDLVTAKPTFAILPRTAKAIGTKVIEVPLTPEKVHDLDAMRKAVTDTTGTVYICNPANPTATVLDPAKLRAFCLEVSQKATVIIDEAYFELLDAPYNESMIPLTKDNKRIIIVKTFSKIYAMAGMRVGYLVAHPDTISELNAGLFRQSDFCVNVLASVAATASLKDPTHAKYCKAQLATNRDYTQQALKGMGYRVIPSYTNFIFYAVPNFKGKFSEYMYDKQKILMRSDDYEDGQWARVSLGTMEEMKQFIEAMKKV
jgi:histidinol-phosphate aminotransferase